MSRGAVQHHHLRGGQCKPQPPPSWSMHFPAEEFDPNDRRALLIREMVNVFASGGGWELLSRSVRQHLDTYVAVLDYQLLCSVARSADLEAAMDMQPAEGLACLSACVYEVCSCPSPSVTPSHLPTPATAAFSPATGPPSHPLRLALHLLSSCSPSCLALLPPRGSITPREG